MGLAVVQGIIKTYKGAVSVASTPGEGSAFEVYFPIIHSNGTVSAESKIVVPGGQERILFVDDELPLADLSQQLLERLGYKVTVRTSAVEALNLFENDPDAFDLVITDMTMPHMTGDILAEKLLALRPDVAIVICTGYSDKITQELIDRLNIRALVMKPIIRNELLITVRQVLDEQNE
jgi:CheY-like chemotaxis protein